MNTRLSVFALSAILVAAVGISPAFGQAEPIVVTTDKDSYRDGETISITGQVRELLSGYPISVKVIAPNGNIVAVKQIEVGPDRSYMVDLTAGGKLMKFEGTYTVEVLYGTVSRTAETTFELGGLADPGLGGTGSGSQSVSVSDVLVEYTITGGSLVGIEPDVESNSLIITIDAVDDGTLTMDFPREVLDSRMDGCSGADDSFIVLIDAEEAEFGEAVDSDSRELTIDFYRGSETIEIIGTCVIPEFGTVAVLVLAVAIVSIIAVTARSKLGIVPKY